MQLQVTINLDVPDDQMEALHKVVGKGMIPTVYREVVRKNLNKDLLDKVTDIEVSMKRGS